MDSPIYTVTVGSLTRGWSYTMTHATPPDPAPVVQLADDVTFRWGFRDGMAPAQLDPSVATLRLWCRTAAHVPLVQIGDLITLTIRLGTAGAYICNPAPLRITLVEVELSDHEQYAAELVITAVDALAELATWVIPTGYGLPGTAGAKAHPRWRVRMGEISKRLGRTIAVPTTWGDDEGPPPQTHVFESIAAGLQNDPQGDTDIYYPNDAGTELARLLNSFQPQGGFTLALVPGWSDAPTAFPTGWEGVEPDTYWSYDATGPAAALFTDTQTSLRYYVMRASRRTPGNVAGVLPIKFILTGGVLTLIAAVDIGGANSRIAFDAGWCDLPATARRSREGVVNQVRLMGTERFSKDAADIPATLRRGMRIVQNADDVALFGPSARDVDTSLDFGYAVDDYHTSKPVMAAIAMAGNSFLTETPGYQKLLGGVDAASARVAWVYDDFTMYASRVPNALAAQVLTHICPRAPGETDGDSQVLRHVTVYRPAASARFADAGGAVNGFIVAGVLRVSDGDIGFTLSLAPGEVAWTQTDAAPITVGQAIAASWDTTPVSTVDPLITVGDLAYVGP